MHPFNKTITGVINISETVVKLAAALAPSVRAFALQAEGWVFESVKTGSNSSTAKPLAIGVTVTGTGR